MMLVHRTDPAGLAGILADGKLRSSTARGGRLLAWSGQAANFVFFSVTPEGPHIHAPIGKNEVILVLDMDSVVAAYPQFVLNDEDNMGPSDGKPGKQGCKGHWTYNTITEIDAPCVKRNLQEMMDVLKYDITNDFVRSTDGPEIAFPGEVNLLPHLRYIRVGPGIPLPPKYTEYRRDGGRRLRTVRRKRKSKRTRKDGKRIR